MRPRAAVDQLWKTTSHGRGRVLLVAVAAVDVEVVMEAAVPAVEGSGEGDSFHSDVRPVPAVMGRPKVMEQRLLR